MDDRAVDKRGPKTTAAGGIDRKQGKTRSDDVPRGIVCMVIATILFTGASAASKWLVAIYPVGEVLCLRSFASLIAGAVAINFSAPLFAALVSIIWLKEPAGFVRGGALVIGFVGVLIVTNPGSNSLTLGALFALTNAVMYGTVTVAVRGMTRTESANTLVMWQLAVLAFFHSFLLLFGWRSPSPIDAAMLFGTGFTNAVGQWFWTKALQLAPAPAVTPFYYLMLVWALMFGFLIWGDLPSARLLVGSAIVVMTGLFLFLREARLQRQLAAR